MKRSILVLILLVLAALPARAATTAQENQIWYRLHLGMGKGDYAVAPQVMRDFIDSQISPAFPNGFTITDSRGQWKSSEYGLIRERTIVVDVQCDDTDENWQTISDIAERYVQRFQAAQASFYVMRIPGLTTTLFY